MEDCPNTQMCVSCLCAMDVGRDKGDVRVRMGLFRRVGRRIRGRFRWTKTAQWRRVVNAPKHTSSTATRVAEDEAT